MIITEQLLIELGADQELLDWCQNSNLYGKIREDFIQSIKDAGNTVPVYYLTWSETALFSRPAFKILNTYSYTGDYRLDEPGGISQTFTTFEEAQVYQSDQQNAYHTTELHVFHVHARHIIGVDGYTATYCDIAVDTAPSADYYASFNHEIGQYVNFDTYQQARDHALNLKHSRKTLTDGMFRLQQQIAGPDGALVWEDCI